MSFTFLTTQTIGLYLRSGYGLANSYVLFGIPFRNSDKFNVGVFNIGAGLKFLVNNNAALRMEINYKSSNRTDEHNGYSLKETLSDTRLLIGFSILLYE